MTPKSMVSVDSSSLSPPFLLSAAQAALTSRRVSIELMESPAISFLAVRLLKLALRSAMEPRSLREGWSGM